MGLGGVRMKVLPTCSARHFQTSLCMSATEVIFLEFSGHPKNAYETGHTNASGME